MSITDSVISQPYEDFIKLAWSCKKDEYEASYVYMQNLIDK